MTPTILSGNRAPGGGGSGSGFQPDDVTLEEVAGIAQVKDGSIGSLQLEPTIANFQGPYSGATTYSEGDIVTSKGASYMSLADGNLNHTPPNATYWVLMFACDLAYRTLYTRGGTGFTSGNITNTTPRVLGNPPDTPPVFANQQASLGALWLDPADYPAPAADLTLKLRYRLLFITNHTAFAAGAYSITPALRLATPITDQGAGLRPGLTQGAIVSGSDSNIISGSPLTIDFPHHAENEFTFPVAGLYAMSLTPSGVPAANANAQIYGTLDYRWV